MKRKIAWLCMITILILVLAPQVTYANMDKGKVGSIIEIEKNKKICDISVEELNATDMLVLNSKEYKNQRIESMKEVLDNGTQILVTGDQAECVVADFETSLIIENDEESVLAGYLIESNGEGYLVSPVEYSLLEAESQKMSNKEKKERLRKLVEEEGIDTNELWKRAQNWEGIDLNDVDESMVARLQTGVSIADAYTQSKSYKYLYGNKVAWFIPGEVQYYDEDGYTKIGMLDFLIYAIKKETTGTKTYDLVVGQCRAGGINNAIVQVFDVSIGLGSSNDETLFIGDYAHNAEVVDEVTTFQLQSSAESLSSGVTTSYTYKSGDLDSIEEVTGRNALARKWRCDVHEVKNGVAVVKPSVLLLCTKGTTLPITASIYVDYIRISYGYTSYTCEKSTGTHISFCNHYEYSY